MCLRYVTQERTLKKDKRIWKVVLVYDNGMEGSLILLSGVIFTSKRVLVAKPCINMCLLDGFADAIAKDIAGKTYIPYFHCFLKKKDAVRYNEHVGGGIREFIVPAGTKVVYGKSFCDNELLDTIVTPVLINPRVPRIRRMTNERR